MPRRAWLDANAAIALLEGPTNTLHAPAVDVFRRVAEGQLEVIVTAPVIVELAWYLEQRLRWDRVRSASRLVQLIHSDNVIVLDPSVEASLELFRRNRRLDFVACYLAACASTLGPSDVVSFDRDFDRIDGIARISS